MAQDDTFDLLVIGGGPAGYVGAIRAAQLGLKVACVERDALGGVCLNWGCIPTKALLGTAEFYHRLTHDAEKMGISAQNVTHDWQRVIERSRQVAGNLNKGIGGLFRKNKIEHIQGHATIVAKGKVEIFDTPGGKRQRTLSCKNILIATGAGPREMPGAPFDGERIIGSKQAMSLPEQPKSLIIIGAGAIGAEFAYFYNAFGTKVTMVEMQERILPVEDADASAAVARSFKKIGIDVHSATKTLKVEKTDSGVSVTIAPVADEKKTQTLTADKVLVAIGVQGKFDGLFDDKLGVEIVKNHINVDRDTYQTAVPGIYAVGDVIGPPWLAHVASEEAIVCVEQIAGHHPNPIDYDTIPGCTYCQPQVASVGWNEDKCKQEGVDYSVGKFPFTALGKAQAVGHTEGFIKIIADKKYGEILGVHMVGDNVTELIAEAALAKRAELTVDELIDTIHAHPTMAEAVHEAALGTRGRMLHF